MSEEILKAFLVVISSGFKFLIGPLQGYIFKLPPLITGTSTVLGMMISVVLFTYFGAWLKRRFFRNYFNKPVFSSPKNIKISRFIRKYGLGGIALLTPILLTPIGGTLLAVSMNNPRYKIVWYMLISACMWSAIITTGVYAFGKTFFPHFVQ